MRARLSEDDEDMTGQTRQGKSIWDAEIAIRAVWDSVAKLNPRTLMKNPVMFVVEIGAALRTIQLVRNALNHTHAFAFEFQIDRKSTRLNSSHLGISYA